MKQQIRFAAMLLAAALVAAACEKETPAPVNEGPETAKTVTISVSMPDELTKVALSQKAAGGMELVWEAGDQITVQQHGNTSTAQTFTLTSGAGDKKAEFTGTAVTGSSFDIIYTKAGSLTQAADGSTDHIGYSATLSGVSSYESVKFAADWASANGGSLIQSGVLHVKAKLPAAAADSVKTVTLKASKAIFSSADNLTVTITTPGSADDVIDVYATIDGDSSLASGDWMRVEFGCPAAKHSIYTRYIPIDAAKTFAAGSENTLEINCVNTDKYAGLNDAGTATAPYLIADKFQFAGMASLGVDDETKYFKLLNDIDMEGLAMTALFNTGSGYKHLVDFDGNNKTVSNLGSSMFYVFKGSVKNLTLEAPTPSNGSQKGVFAQYIQGENNYITNVDIKNVSKFDASSGNCGGLIGRINSGTGTTATIKDCDLTNVPVNSTGKAGGLIGSVEAAVVIENCTVTGGTVSNTNHYTGGLVGYATYSLTVKKCTTDVEVKGTGKYRVGGLIGWDTVGTISQCCVKGSISSNGYAGGLVGTVDNSAGQKLTISESCFTGTLTTTGNQAGGIVGSKENGGALSIKDCYVTGTISASGPQRYGGIQANHYAGTSTLENCYFAGTLQTNACLGGIVGWVEADGLSVTRCMSYPVKIFASQTVTTADRYCSGIIIGYANKSKSPKMIVDQCYRPAGINFLDYTGVASANVIEDHAFITTAASIPQRHDLQYGYYHHGKQTDSATLSALVQRTDIGGAWSSSIWDFTQDYPRLKWMLD